MSERIGLGLWRGPDAIPENLEPGQPPHPSEGYQGPPVSLPIEGLEKMQSAIRELGEATSRLGFDFVAGNATGQTDSSGNAVVGIYQVAAGVEARMHRLTGNALNPSTGAPYTPAATYANASAYILLVQADTPLLGGIAPAGLLDFGPPTAGGPIFPFVMTDNSQQASFVRGPAWFVVQVAVGPASTSLTFRYQISLRRESGIA